MILLYIILTFFILYGCLFIYYWRAWRSVPFYSGGGVVHGKISIIIPARNEEKLIGSLLSSLQRQTYSPNSFEVIVVDDHSTDQTAAIVKQFPAVKLIQLIGEETNSYKKKAIETGIKASNGDLIITTDADCLAPPRWLETMAAYQDQNESVFIAAPVVYNNNNSMLEIFQSIDFMVMQVITGASVFRKIHSMCNGANLAYEKAAFNEVGGFSGIDQIASGDDMLLMHKIWKRYPDRVHYLKSTDAIVSTAPMKTWKDFFNQRIRWASKAKQYDDKRITAVLLLVYLFNLCFPALLVVGFFCYYYWIWLGGLWVAKTLVELPLTFSAADFFGKKDLLKYFLFFQPLHIVYVLTSGFLGQIGKYEWKGRKVR